jgi:hypothetical protein
MFLLKVFHPLNIYKNATFCGPTLIGATLHSPQKFERPPFWSGYSYGIKNYGIEVTINGMTSLLNFINICQLVQKLIEGNDTDRMVILLAYIFPLGRKVG